MAAQREGGSLTEFRCADCGYGASRRSAPERCPMCSGVAWIPWPSASFVPDLGSATPLTRETLAEPRTM